MQKIPNILLFSGNTPDKGVTSVILSYIRTVILYLTMIVVIRLLGKRQISQMEPSEFVVTMMIANLATIPMEDDGIALFAGFVPICVILGAELVLSFLNLKNSRIRRLLCGKPVILIENGNILQQNLRKTRISLDELTGHLREKDILDIQSVQYAILETNGNLSVFPYPKEKPASARDAGIKVRQQFLPITIVSDGELMAHNLAIAKKDRQWLKQGLEENHADLQDTWLRTVDSANHVVFFRKEL